MRQQQTWLWLVMLIGLAARAGLGIVQSDDFRTDSDGYLAHARPVASGEGFVGPYSHRPTAFRPPAYPITLGLLMWCGFSESASVAIVNAVASVLIIMLTWKLAVQIRLPVALGVLTALVVALDPLLVRYYTLPMTEVPCAAVLLAAVVCFREAMTRGEKAAATRMTCIAGVLFGLGILVRPVVLVSCGILTLHAVFRPEYYRRHPGLKPAAGGLLRVLLPAAIAAATLAPWVVRNTIQFQRFIPATTHGGYTLALGNNADFYRDVISGTDQFPWDGSALGAWQEQMIAESALDGVIPGDEPATDAWYYRKAMAVIRDNPVSFSKAILLRMRRFWALSTADDQMPWMIVAAVSIWYATLWIGIVFQLIGGLLSRNSKQFSGLSDLWLVVLSFMLMHSVYWTDTRMRAPLMPILCVLSVSGWHWAYSVVADEFSSKKCT